MALIPHDDPKNTILLESGKVVELAKAVEGDQHGLPPENILNQQLTSQGDGLGKSKQSIAIQDIINLEDDVITTSAAHGYAVGDFVNSELIAGPVNFQAVNGIDLVREIVDVDKFKVATPAGVNLEFAGAEGQTAKCAIAFVYKPAADEIGIVHKLNGYGSSSTYDSTKYFGVDELPNGIEIIFFRNDTPVQTITSCPVKKWTQWSCNVASGINSNVGGVAQRTQAFIPWAFSDTFGPLRVDGSKNEFIAVIVRDDLTGLEAQEMAVQGTKHQIV